MADNFYKWQLEELKEEIYFLKLEIEKLKTKDQNKN